MSYMCGNPLLTTSRATTEGIATAAQTAIPINGGYVPGVVDVYVGGACLSKGDYSDSDGFTITLAKAMALGTQYRVVAFNPSGVVGNYVAKTGDTMTGNLSFSGIGLRIQGNFSEVSQANRLLFQTNTANSATSVGAIPTGAGTGSNFIAYASPDASNSAYLQFYANPTSGVTGITSGATGSGTAVPFNLMTGGAVRYSLDQSGNHTFSGLSASFAHNTVYVNGPTQSIVAFQKAGVLRYAFGWDGTNMTCNRYTAAGAYASTPWYARDTDGALIAGNGVVSNAFDGQGANYRLGGGAGDAMLRIDSNNFYILLSNAAGGTYNAARPFTVALSTGIVTIDSTGAGTVFGKRPTWQGFTPWDSNNLASPAQTNGLIYTASHVRLAGGTIDSNWYFQGQSGTPAWVWGGSDGINMYVYQPSQMSVNYANTCGTASVAASANTLANDISLGTISFGNMRAANGSAGNISGRGGGAYVGWNESGGQGESVLTTNNAGSAGGWVLRTVNSNNSAEIGRFVISPSGTGTSGSDVRLKKNIVTIENALDRVCQLRGVSFEYRSNGDKSYGVIAQELQPVFPDAVVEMGAGLDKEDYLGAQYTALVGPLIEAIKELKGQLDSALQRIATLEAA
jgi:hypothetical protein